MGACTKTQYRDTDNKCKACPTGYTCDGTKEVTKKQKVCAKDFTSTAKCLTCPKGHTCKNNLAKTDGKTFVTTKAKATPKKTTAKPKKESKLSNSNTLSVALPLCLT